MEKEKEAIKEITDKAKQLIDMVNDIYEGYKAIGYTFDNIAITYNNKMVEIIQMYRKHNVSIDDSELMLVIQYHLQHIVNDALDYLIKLVSIIKEQSEITLKENSLLYRIKNKSKNIKIKEKLKKEEIELTSRYLSLVKKVFDFDIGKEINKIYEERKDFFEKMEGLISPFITNNQVFINNCNIDLRDLGYQERIPYDNQQDKKYPTIFNREDDITEIAYQKISASRMLYSNYPGIKTAVETHLVILYSKATLIASNQEEFEKILNEIKKFDIKNDIEVPIGEFLALSVDDDEENEKEVWRITKEELINLEREDLIPKLEKAMHDNKYQYIVEEVDQELDQKVEKSKKMEKHNKVVL